MTTISAAIVFLAIGQFFLAIAILFVIITQREIRDWLHTLSDSYHVLSIIFSEHRSKRNRQE